MFFKCRYWKWATGTMVNFCTMYLSFLNMILLCLNLVNIIEENQTIKRNFAILSKKARLIKSSEKKVNVIYKYIYEI